MPICKAVKRLLLQWFAYYGEQDGDGTATVTREEQQRLTVDAIVNKLIK